MEMEDLKFFIARELSHIQAGHTWLRVLLKPLGSDVAIIGKLVNTLIFGDWANRSELTADRGALIERNMLEWKENKRARPTDTRG